MSTEFVEPLRLYDSTKLRATKYVTVRAAVFVVQYRQLVTSQLVS